VIAFFTRQNPLIDSSWLLSGCADVVNLSSTVCIDLRKPETVQNKEMTKGHRYDIRKAKNNGVTAREVEYFEFLDTFISIYYETMGRTGACDYYFFPKQYFLQLKENLGDAVRLYIAEAKGEVIAAAIFLLSNKIIQYHLSGALSAFLSLSGAKVIIDEVRRWGTDNGFFWFHLGGGVSSVEDSLFRFKAGFSKLRFQFQVIKWIIDPMVYNEAIKRSKQLDSCFFPAYRKPLN
jgi:lipid II:glycine glycyltransferase (peptidoglycan interpeptide bridge formation enzyme)